MSENNNEEIFEAEVCEICEIEKPKKILMVVTQADHFDEKHKTGLWFEEFAVPYLAFIEQGYTVIVATPAGGAAPLDPDSENLLDDIRWNKAKEGCWAKQDVYRVHWPPKSSRRPNVKDVSSSKVIRRTTIPTHSRSIAN